MRKLLKPKELLLLVLANILDFYEEARDPFSIGANSHKDLYGWIPRRFKHHNFSQLVKRELTTGNIEKVEKDGEVYLRITRVGKETAIQDFPLLVLKKRKWDGKWRLVVFDIEEKSKKTREVLRSKLQELGFGMLQKSVWLSPHDIILDLKEFIKAKGLEDFVYTMEVSHLLSGDPKILAEKVWKLEELNQRYEKILVAAEKLRRAYIETSDRMTSSMKSEMRNEFSDLRRRYMEVLLSDPALPKELLPQNYLGEKVFLLLKSIKS